MTSRGWLLTASVGLAVGLTACGGDPQGPDFAGVPGVSGKLAYATSITGNGGSIRYELRILDFQTGSTRTVYTTPMYESISSIAWHPDGHSLVIATANVPPGAVSYRLMRLNEDGTGLTAVVDGFDPNGARFPAAYSPQGALAYCAQEPIADPQAAPVEGLFVDGVLIWPGNCLRANGPPSWSPDGSGVALIGFCGGAVGLCRVDLSTKTATLMLPAPSPGGLYTPAVSPQGDVIAVSGVDANREVTWLVRSDGSGSLVLPSSGDGIQWSRDASRILFVRGFRLYVREMGTGTDRKIADTEMLTIAWHSGE